MSVRSLPKSVKSVPVREQFEPVARVVGEGVSKDLPPIACRVLASPSKIMIRDIGANLTNQRNGEVWTGQTIEYDRKLLADPHFVDHAVLAFHDMLTKAVAEVNSK